MSEHFLGLRTAVYRVRDLAPARAWYTAALGIEPYFDESYYIGYNIGGYELGLVPLHSPDDPSDAHGGERADAGTAYWGVLDADASYARLISLGAKDIAPVEDVGGGIRAGAVQDPFGNTFGVIFNPHFSLP